MNTILIYTACWIGMAVIGILNGIMRDYLYGYSMHELSAHQLSTLIGLILFGTYIWFLTSVRQIESAKQALIIGAIWLAMTVVFEFVFGHYISGHAWRKLFHDYNLLRGRVWSLVLIETSIAPYLFYQFRTRQFEYRRKK